MASYLIALAVLLAGGLVACVAGRSSRVASFVGAASVALGSGAVLVQSIGVLMSGQSRSLRLAWPLPMGSANMELDPLSAVFAAAIALVTALAAVYGSGYLCEEKGKKKKGSRPHLPKRPSGCFAQMGSDPFFFFPGVSWFFFNLLAASMLLVLCQTLIFG